MEVQFSVLPKTLGDGIRALLFVIVIVEQYEITSFARELFATYVTRGW